MIDEHCGGSDATAGVTAVTCCGEATEVEAAEVRGNRGEAGGARHRFGVGLQRKARSHGDGGDLLGGPGRRGASDFCGNEARQLDVRQQETCGGSLRGGKGESTGFICAGGRLDQPSHGRCNATAGLRERTPATAEVAWRTVKLSRSEAVDAVAAD